MRIPGFLIHGGQRAPSWEQRALWRTGSQLTRDPFSKALCFHFSASPIPVFPRPHTWTPKLVLLSRPSPGPVSPVPRPVLEPAGSRRCRSRGSGRAWRRTWSRRSRLPASSALGMAAPSIPSGPQCNGCGAPGLVDAAGQNQGSRRPHPNPTPPLAVRSLTSSGRQTRTPPRQCSVSRPACRGSGPAARTCGCRRHHPARCLRGAGSQWLPRLGCPGHWEAVSWGPLGGPPLPGLSAGALANRGRHGY